MALYKYAYDYDLHAWLFCECAIHVVYKMQQNEDHINVLATLVYEFRNSISYSELPLIDDL